MSFFLCFFYSKKIYQFRKFLVANKAQCNSDAVVILLINSGSDNKYHSHVQKGMFFPNPKSSFPKTGEKTHAVFVNLLLKLSN